MIFAVGIGMSAAPSGTGGGRAASRLEIIGANERAGPSRPISAHLGPSSFLPSIQSGGAVEAVPKQIPFYGTRERGEGERNSVGTKVARDPKSFL